MKILFKIFLIAILSLSGVTCMAQVAPAKENPGEGILNKPVLETNTMNNNLNADNNKQDQNSGNKKGSVKQVKSARPDMSRSRGARPPDIVRPSGSRIPKGVGRPAGAVRRGRG
jgi:hypothetical protein